MILYLRHFESEKNVAMMFSSVDNNEHLTQKGLEKAVKASESIFTFSEKFNLTIPRIYCADSIRAKTTASVLAKSLNVDFESSPALNSNNSGTLRGKNEQEAKKTNPLFMHQLNLFRAGIFSSYDFVKVYEREDKHAFEERVNRFISEHTVHLDSYLNIFVLHHSSLTAALINVAREYYNYPCSFYGHVACDLGNCYLVANNGIIVCNEPVDKLLEIELCN